MLIRSQDKSCICNCEIMNTIGVLEVPNGAKISMVLGERLHDIGVYSSFEKGLKVLDMIEKEYLAYGTIGNKNVGITSAFTLPKVFRMPADDEVEV